MRIISDFHDYYDCIQSYGQDDLLYVRNRKEVEHRLVAPSVDLRRFPIYSKVIGFCGKFYPMVYCVPGDNPHSVKTFCYCASEVHKWVNANLKKKEIEEYYQGKERGSKYRFSLMKPCKRIEKFFDEGFKQQNNFLPLFVKHDAPILTTKYVFPDKHYLVLNPRLANYEFFRIMDTYQAFQELSMWFGQKVEPRKPIPHIPDIDMVEIKGFDKRYSFRKDPEK